MQGGVWQVQAGAGQGDPLRGQVQNLRHGPRQAVRDSHRAGRRAEEGGGKD